MAISTPAGCVRFDSGSLLFEATVSRRNGVDTATPSSGSRLMDLHVGRGANLSLALTRDPVQALLL